MAFATRRVVLYLAVYFACSRTKLLLRAVLVRRRVCLWVRVFALDLVFLRFWATVPD